MNVTCGECGKDTAVAVGNTVVFHRTSHPWFSYSRTICKSCGEPVGVFFGHEHESLFETFVKMGVGIVMEPDQPSQQFVEDYDRIMGTNYLPLLYPPPLTTNQKHLVDDFHLDLDACGGVEDLLRM